MIHQGYFPCGAECCIITIDFHLLCHVVFSSVYIMQFMEKNKTKSFIVFNFIVNRFISLSYDRK